MLKMTKGLLNICGGYCQGCIFAPHASRIAEDALSGALLFHMVVEFNAPTETLAEQLGIMELDAGAGCGHREAGGRGHLLPPRPGYSDRFHRCSPCTLR